MWQMQTLQLEYDDVPSHSAIEFKEHSMSNSHIALGYGYCRPMGKRHSEAHGLTSFYNYTSWLLLLI